MSFGHRILILVGMFAVSFGAVLFVAPIPQNPTFHLFADMRSCLGIPNFGDVSSNVGFAVVGLLGLWSILGPGAKERFPDKLDALPYILFFTGVGLVSIGSAYYHAAPDNARLFWDRLPMTIAFTALFSAIVADRIDKRIGIRGLLPVCVVLGVVSLVYWDWSETNGIGDLRFYGLVQFYPLLALPVICWLFPKAHYTDGGYIAWIIGWYAVAKVLEHFDAEIFDMFGRAISGHSLKHLASAVATFVVWRMMTQQSRQAAAKS